MTVLERNLAVLAERAPELARRLVPEPAAEPAIAPPPLTAQAARDGQMTATSAYGWLHSRYAPRLEAERLCAAAAAKGATGLVCLGLGLGYAAEAALRAGLSVVVAESDARWLRACLAIRPLEACLADPRLDLVLCLDGAGLMAALQHRPGRLGSIENPAFLAAFPLATAAFRQAVARCQEKETININTLRRFGRLWVRNLVKNAAAIAVSPGVDSLRGLFEGLPALVLAAGPTLDAVLPQLAVLRQRCLLVCVDTALRSLLRHGIEPDFLVTVDPQLYNAWHLHHCSSPSSILISEGAVWPAVLRQRCRRLFMCSSQYPLGRALEERCRSPKGTLGAGGSVATTAWDFARSLGCRPIYMAGLDLSFPGGQTHAGASLFEQRSLAAGRRLSPASGQLFQASLSGQPYLAEANDGRPVRTDKRLALYAWWYTRTLAKYPDQTTWNLSASGLAISGMPVASLDAVLGLPECRAELNQRLDRLCQSNQDEQSGQAAGRRAGQAASNDQRLSQAVASLVAELDDIGRLASEAVRLSRQASACLKSPAAAPSDALPDLMTALDRIDQAVLQNSARDIAGFLFPDSHALAGQPASSLVDSLANTEGLYRQIGDSAAWHSQLLGRILDSPNADE
ncbi:MAG: hypothetical protein A2087_07970 [Spirochaetes bacterium GWD1_61_31]|nr:MAG: hypothetical protein A2Y37_06210 [Spirochaetes bacterium GWB1_60_80]OHD34994.1 MAG: hypothetical protein A2004_04035 [Spirochaetes bacterium GWC1_61_12]OHD40471.1 MAG: hypothetical protein A2087_07970 [Spirochaetes bacterium GWD1_61_31]OHD43056.1 MAG: hypothetical protein A2Y35_01400 [Spirochaetes bacterium GWE1_60_18]OHD59652.1 MAG: hypothetical protein A2Y32_12280 [Spirochaetes bacterium GWF1_60_12]HAP44125.1 hypothetical protein [Spirochaetaceae bacterium]